MHLIYLMIVSNAINHCTIILIFYRQALSLLLTVESFLENCADTGNNYIWYQIKRTY